MVSEVGVETMLPSAYPMGMVVARIGSAVGDATASGDPYPDALFRAVTGAAEFIPTEKARIVEGDPATYFTHESILADLDADGYLCRNGQRGVWLWAGEWVVKFPKHPIAGFEIVITTAHTAEHPCDLFEAVHVPLPGEVVQTVILPVGQDGQVLVWQAGGWVAAPAPNGGGGTVDLSEYARTAQLAPVATSGQYADLTGAPDLSGHVLTSQLATVATSGRYADLTGQPDLDGYARTAQLAAVATTGQYSDLTGKPDLSRFATLEDLTATSLNTVAAVTDIPAGAPAGSWWVITG